MGACLELDVRKAYELEMKRLELNRQAASLMNKMNGPKSNRSKTPPKVVEHNLETNVIKQLDLTIGYNHSDTTFGWKGYKNALTLYYLHPG